MKRRVKRTSWVVVVVVVIVGLVELSLPLSRILCIIRRLFVCLSVCYQPHVKATDRVFMKISSEMYLQTEKN